jgi:hypothetical protein
VWYCEDGELQQSVELHTPQVRPPPHPPPRFPHRSRSSHLLRTHRRRWCIPQPT